MKQNSIMISICMATYNGGQFIESQLASLIGQIKQDDEIIVSDDGSTDETVKIIESFNDKRIKIYLNEYKSGPVGNFQNAIRHAKGDVIFLCDQDDLWFENKIVRHMECHKKYDLVVSNAVVIDERKNIIFESFFKERNSKNGLVRNLMRNSYIGCCMSFNRKIISASLPFPKDIHMHDWWIGLVAEITGRIHFLNEPLMYYIRHSNNASGTLIKTLPFIEQFKNRIILMKNLLAVLVQNIHRK